MTSLESFSRQQSALCSRPPAAAAAAASQMCHSHFSRSFLFLLAAAAVLPPTTVEPGAIIFPDSNILPGREERSPSKERKERSPLGRQTDRTNCNHNNGPLCRCCRKAPKSAAQSHLTDGRTNGRAATRFLLFRQISKFFRESRRKSGTEEEAEEEAEEEGGAKVGCGRARGKRRQSPRPFVGCLPVRPRPSGARPRRMERSAL